LVDVDGAGSVYETGIGLGRARTAQRETRRSAARGAENEVVLSVLLLWRRFAAALRVALREEDFTRVLSAGILLVVVGTVTYTFANGWSPVDGSTSRSRR
jgi:hypothetical protein